MKRTREWGKIIAGEVKAAKAKAKVKTKRYSNDCSKKLSQKVYAIENTLDDWYEMDYFKEYDEKLLNEARVTKYYTENGEALERS